MRQKYARDYDPRPAMVECYVYFHEQIDALARSADYQQPADERLNQFFLSLRGSLQVVTIELDGNDDPQVIFETLNARGQPLLPSDLLRNYIFWRAEQNKEPSTPLYEQHWLEFDEPFWRELERQGRLLRPRSDLFLQHYLAMKRKGEVSIGHLFAEYKHWIKSSPAPFTSVSDELKDLSVHRRFYRKLVESEAGTALGRLARMLRVFDTTTAYPLILGLLGRDLSDAVRDGIFEDLESYILRRAISGLTSKAYNRIFLTLLAKLPDALSRETFQALLLDLQGESSLWPDDKRFEQEWLQRPIYQQLNSGQLGAIFQSIELRLHHKKSERIEVLGELTVEHVIPQKWFEHWPLPNGRPGLTYEQRIDQGLEKEDSIASQNRDRILHTFGNLTLITGALNTSISNGPYAEKRVELLKYGALSLNRYFQDVTDWSEALIEQRGRMLFDIACQVWMHPGHPRDDRRAQPAS